MGLDDVASGYLISTGFHRLKGCQQDPLDRGVTEGGGRSQPFGR